ncbi:MAG: alpha/beta hydrolase [Chloroflexota bacterium]
MPTINLENISLYYEEQGAGEPLILLHGLGSDGRSWEYQRPSFAQQFRVIVVDVRGHGRSAKPLGPYSVPQFANDIFALLDYLQIDRFHLLGLSMGGMIGCQMAQDQPERFLSLTIVNSGPELVAQNWQEALANCSSVAWYQLHVHAKNRRIYWRTAVPEPHQALQSAVCAAMSENDPSAYKGGHQCPHRLERAGAAGAHSMPGAGYQWGHGLHAGGQQGSVRT